MKFVRFIETMQAWGFDVYQVSFPLKNTDFFFFFIILQSTQTATTTNEQGSALY